MKYFDKILISIKPIINWFIRLNKTIQEKKGIRLVVNLAMILIVLVYVGISLLKQWSTIKDLGIVLKPLPLVYSMGLLGLNYVFFLLAWNLLVKLFSSSFNLFENSRVYSYSQLAKLLPTPIWFISSRVLLYNSEKITKKSVLISTMLEALINTWVGFLFFCVLSIKINQPITWLYSLGIPITYLIVKVVISNEWTRTQLSYNSCVKIVLGTIGLVILIWLTSNPFLTLIIQGIIPGSSIQLVEVWKIWIISSIFSYIGSFTLGGIGVLREFSLILLLGKYFSPPVCLLIAVISRLIITIGNLLWPAIIIVIVKVFNKITEINLVKSEK